MKYNIKEITRRGFIATTVKTTLGGYLAFSYGSAIAAVLDQKDTRIGLIYASRYGATADNAAWIAKGAGLDVTLLDIEAINVSSVINRYDRFIVGSGVWREGIHEAIRTMMTKYAAVFDEKLIASFVVCGTQPNSEENKARIAGYFSGIHDPLKQPPLLSQALGGRLRVESLSEQDYELLSNFYHNILKTELANWDRTDPAAARSFGEQTNRQIRSVQTRRVSGAV